MAGVIYAINGRPLHEGHTGWRILRSGTSTQGGVTKSLAKVTALGMDGYVPAPSVTAEQIVVLVVRTPRARLDELLSLCNAATTLTKVGDSTKEAYVQLNSAIPSGDAVYDDTFDVSITLSIYQGVWRDVTATTDGPTTIASPSQVFQMFADLSAPIRDMDIFIRGVFGQFVLTDSAGSWLKTTSAWAGSGSTGLLFVGSTGQAFLANESSPFTPVTDMSHKVDVSGNGGFRMTPKHISGDPANRIAELTLTTLTQTSTTLRVRAKRAYRMN